MSKTTQVLKMNVHGVAFVCTFTPERTNPYRLYRTWWDGGTHKKMVGAWANFQSVLCYLVNLQPKEFYRDCFKVRGGAV